MSTPLYKLRLGAAKDSDGIQCAKAAGLPADIINRAKCVKECVANKLALPSKMSIAQQFCRNPKVMYTKSLKS